MTKPDMDDADAAVREAEPIIDLDPSFRNALSAGCRAVPQSPIDQT
jgi:hypothetical protein